MCNCDRFVGLIPPVTQTVPPGTQGLAMTHPMHQGPPPPGTQPVSAQPPAPEQPPSSSPAEMEKLPPPQVGVMKVKLNRNHCGAKLKSSVTTYHKSSLWFLMKILRDPYKCQRRIAYHKHAEEAVGHAQ